MVSGMDLFKNPSFVVLLFSTALEVFKTRDYIRQMSSLPRAMSSMRKMMSWTLNRCKVTFSGMIINFVVKTY